MIACLTKAQSVTALWDFQNVNPSTLTGMSIEGTTGTVASTVEGIVLTVDATNGKLSQRPSDAQFNAGTKIQVPVVSTKDVVTVTSYPNYHNYNVGGEAATADVTSYTAKTTDVSAGYVEIVGTGSSYLYNIQVVQQGTMMEKELYTTNFTEWGDYATNAAKKVTTASWQTKYSHETLTFSIYDTQISASNFNTGKFPNWDGGMLMAAKSSDPYIITSALASITKVVFMHGATGSKRGWKLEAKGDGDADWVTISDAVANPATGATVEAEVNRTNCQLRFTNLTTNQNAYLLSLDIFGNVDMSKTPSLGSFAYNGTTYQVADIFEETSEGMQTTTIKVKNDVELPSEANPVTDLTFDNGSLADNVTYTTTSDGVLVSIKATANEDTVTYNATFIHKPYYTLSYYNTDGAVLESTQKVEEDEAIGTLRSGDGVTVDDGQTWRGWFAESDGGRKYTTADIISSDTKLYAVATAIETESATARYSYNLKDEYFYDEDHEAFNATGAAWHDATHGWAMSAGSSIELLVGGNAYIMLGLCGYSNGDAKFTLTDASGNAVSSIAAKGSSDGASASMYYEGAAGKLTLSVDGTAYLHSLTIANVAGSPVATNEAGYYVVKAGDADNFLTTLEVANANASADARTYIFLPNGTYDLGNACLTPITGDNISIIGQSQEKTIIKNLPDVEGIGVTATLYNTASNIYLQDLTLQNAYPYDGANTGRAVCLQDKGERTICKNVELKSYQDTYYSNPGSGNRQYYFETSNIHGTVDFICGGGDVFFNKCTLTIEKRSSGCTITAPYNEEAKGDKFGYVFDGCTINSIGDTKYNYGRAWGGNASCAYLNTTLLQPNCLAANRWTLAGMNVAAEKFVEYNTMDESGTVISPSTLELTFTKDNTTNTMETILTADQAADYALDKVFTDWTPADLAAQKTMGELTLSSTNLSWAAVDGAKCYAVFKGDNLLGFTTATSYTVDEATATYSVRAANDMGGLGEAVSVTGTDCISTINDTDAVVNTQTYNIMGLQVKNGTKGLLIKGGKKVIVK